MSMQATNKQNELPVRRRQNELINNLHKRGVLHSDGRSLESLTPEELENLNIEVMNDYARAYFGGD
ncbi:Fur-regulated basic protein FbpA [Oceanobacillus sp. FSL H7-0719]|uniref:Fur-regulated basic protein FbpA n=1 Tax=Oceanobacillus sp. FSL H7-0719 TaxID=2954507 RepID=UPI0032509526